MEQFEVPNNPEIFARRFAELVRATDPGSRSASKNRPLEELIEAATGWKVVAVKQASELKNLRNRISEVRNRPDQPRHLVLLVPQKLLSHSAAVVERSLAERQDFDIVGIGSFDAAKPAIELLVRLNDGSVPEVLKQAFPGLAEIDLNGSSAFLPSVPRAVEDHGAGMRMPPPPPAAPVVEVPPLPPDPSAARVRRYIADDPSVAKMDLLGMRPEANAFARLIAAKDVQPPMAIGIFGDWGAGKTFFMRQIQAHISFLDEKVSTSGLLTQDSSEKLFLTDIVPIHFDAWHYTETNLWASLVDCIFSALDRWMHDHAESNQSADVMFDRLSTSRQLKLDALELLLQRRVAREVAEERAARARSAYELGLAKSKTLRPGAYLNVLMRTFLNRVDVQKELRSAGRALGIDALESSATRLQEVLTEARTESGKLRVLNRAALAKFGSFRWVFLSILVLVGLPLLVPVLTEWVAGLPRFHWLSELRDAAARATGLLLACSGILTAWVKAGRAALRRLEKLDQDLTAHLQEQKKSLDESAIAQELAESEEGLKRQEQTLRAAEAAVAEADEKLADARETFENETARGRLNAFIRSKVTDGDYARHLGIIASIRRDFGQLAALMQAASDRVAEKQKRDRMNEDSATQVKGFLQRLVNNADLRLEQTELQSMFAVLDPIAAREILKEWSDRLAPKVVGGLRALESIDARLEADSHEKYFPTFSRIVLYIDDLDRCPPEKVAEVLQAVHLLLSFPLFVVVVAVDARWISTALSQRFPNLLSNGHEGSATSNGATARDYLEKIFQIPYWVQPMGEDAGRQYVRRLVGRDPTPATVDSEAPVETNLALTSWEADWLEAFAPVVGAIPRRALRFVNVYRLVKTTLNADLATLLVGARGESPVYRTLIAQIAMFTADPGGTARLLEVLKEKDAQMSLAVLLDQMKAWNNAPPRRLRDAIQLLHDRSIAVAAPLTVQDLLETSSIARRFSFGA
jgi:hypothetical protein